jgi:hypothetical protein
MNNEYDDIEEDDNLPELITTNIFGHQFRTLRGLAEDLITLEKEGAIYSHFWDEPSNTFRYYRIKFLPREIFEYVEAHVAKQQYDDAIESGASFEEAVESVENPTIRERVISYGDYGKTVMRDGSTEDIRGCAASFYPPEIEDLVCGRRPERYEVLPNLEKIDKTSLLIRLIDNFRVVAGLLSERGHGRPSFIIENEYDVQDLLFGCIRSFFTDAHREEYALQHAGTSKRIDVVVPSADVLIEVKYVRNASHAKTIADEIKIDVESYHTHPSCKTILVFIYDPKTYIIDPDLIERDLSGQRVKGSSSFDVQVLVRR